MGELVHLIREPATEPAGALILNHGRGADEHDLHGLLDTLDPERRLLGITPGAPFSGADVAPGTVLPTGGGRHWYAVPRVGYPDPATFAQSYEALTGLLDPLLAERGVDWADTAIGGFSMGAVISYALALGPSRPVPGALIALSGFIPQVEGWRAELSGREGLPVLIHHGTEDPVIPVDHARRARDLLSAGGLEPRLLESPAGHWLPAEVIPDLRTFVATVGADQPGFRQTA